MSGINRSKMTCFALPAWSLSIEWPASKPHVPTFEFCEPKDPEEHVPVFDLGPEHRVRLSAIPYVDNICSQLSQPSTYGLIEMDEVPGQCEYAMTMSTYFRTIHGCRVYDVRRADKVPVMYQVVVREDGRAYFAREWVCKPVCVQVV